MLGVTTMRDLINTLDRISRSELSQNRRALLTEKEVRRISPTVAILLDRVDALAYDYLLFQQGRLEGEPDYYNVELLKNEGYDVKFYQRESDSRRGEIITDKGRIPFG